MQEKLNEREADARSFKEQEIDAVREKGDQKARIDAM